MSYLNVPSREDVSPANQAIFDNLEKKIGFVPNLYATYAHSEFGLNNLLQLGGAPSSLSNKEQQIVNLTVSQVNNCDYCLAAHTAMGKGAGFNDDQILEIRTGHASFNEKYDALAALSKNITENRGYADELHVTNFLEAGYTKENLVDVILKVGEKTISNYLHNLTKVPVDFPAAPSLKPELA
ncbi:carboxymuconolactone decarboxylase family protein [Nonlabens ponticola]|uniref:Carboxymuconolactone decarboxylase family protein n=1 Tax=Nonlabens ponticola TaxID=2496866 RepID=A0A3S9N0Y2_9FLAO|nr:carboxymuconolactone decarboxylase family protein [Nonlabens ponticola]AZQ45067.1 carboxymuconolactone decarboxylase family protein [Nonlabens ponticola]